MMGKAGRPKGSKNKAPAAFREKLRAYCESIGVDPFEFLANSLKNKMVKFDQKVNCAKELAKYLEPQLRSVEMEFGEETRRALVHRYRATTNGHVPELSVEPEDVAAN